jgi:hypothetical protein
VQFHLAHIYPKPRGGIPSELAAQFRDSELSSDADREFDGRA